MRDNHIMTSEEMGKMILKMVNERKGVTFVEIRDAIGDDAWGNLAWQIAPNTILWEGLSEALLTALQGLHKNKKIDLYPSEPLVYLMDGDILHLPIAKRATRQGYTKPHWYPVVFNPRQHAVG